MVEFLSNQRFVLSWISSYFSVATICISSKSCLNWRGQSVAKWVVVAVGIHSWRSTSKSPRTFFPKISSKGEKPVVEQGASRQANNKKGNISSHSHLSTNRMFLLGQLTAMCPHCLQLKHSGPLSISKYLANLCFGSLLCCCSCDCC